MHEAEEAVDASSQQIYFFGDNQAEGDPDAKHVLGGKGASLAAMSKAGLPVPGKPGRGPMSALPVSTRSETRRRRSS